MKNINFIQNLKVRGSWGQSGNQFTGNNFAYIPGLQTTIYYPIGASQTPMRGLAPIVLANPNLKWETSTQSDIGIDASFFNGKFDFTK